MHITRSAGAFIKRFQSLTEFDQYETPSVARNGHLNLSQADCPWWYEGFWDRSIQRVKLVGTDLIKHAEPADIATAA